jgi:hypothetical protein
LDHTHIDEECQVMRRLGSVLCEATCGIRRLGLKFFTLDAYSAQLLMAGLAENRTVCKLALSRCKVKEEGMNLLLQFLSKQDRIRQLAIK